MTMYSADQTGAKIQLGGLKAGFRQRLIPFAGNIVDADQKAAAENGGNEENMDQDTVHAGEIGR